MKILLVQPTTLDRNGGPNKWKRPFLPNYTLPYLSALTPRGVEVEIADEKVDSIDFGGGYDLVGISALTSQAVRAYGIADRFREAGIPVVMGGIHVTALPEEAARHCDAVVMGEAENVWVQVLEDAARGRLKGVYRANGFHDMKDLPAPRFDLLKRKDFISPFLPILATKGCPHDCDFCSVSRFFGKSYRFRPLEDVIREITASGAKRFTFVDDNITANRNYSKELFKAMIPLGVQWLGQCTINLGRDPALCRLAAESGCCFMSIGIESVDEDNLASIDKSWNRVKEFPELLSNIRKSGIGLALNMIVGLDNDDRGIFRKTLRFLMDNRAFTLILNTPIPYPGTRLAQRLDTEGRLLHTNWSGYTQGSILYTPRRMSAGELEAGYWSLLDDFFSYPSIARRALGQSCRNLPYYFKRNLDLHMSVKRRVY